ncbi:hypothetical protein CJ030_MR8G022383 [Morella rubra]|uniref:Disease resistance protein At4g27190-like leucine-rich repeats domain-containing protein n=1 Tax=Morella rubra TaxID=262757 RepID=A0A6A1URL8_9ROSI|nr:hypothetical protein CJ030_MR8G022383 [Morella rubra]
MPILQEQTLRLEHCPNLKTFITKPVSSSLMGSKEPNEMNPEEGSHAFMQPLFNEELSSMDVEETQYNEHGARIGCRLTNLQAMSWFQNLSFLEVEGSGNTKHLLSFSTAKAMVYLKHLHILECKCLEEVLVSKELGEGRPNFFPQLECLFLKDLPILKRFYEGSNIEFPCLKKLQLKNCPKLKTFITKSVSSCLTGNKEPNEMNAKEGSNAVMQPLFNEEIGFPSLERLRIALLDDLKIIWENQVAADSFCNLKSIFVKSCKNLRNIFSALVARFLLQLEELRIVNCGVEELVAGEGGAEGIARFVFPQVTILHLISLPRLKWFYPGVHSSKWPKLK